MKDSDCYLEGEIDGMADPPGAPGDVTTLTVPPMLNQ